MLPLEISARRSLAVVNPRSSGASAQGDYLRWLENLGGAVRSVESEHDLRAAIGEAARGHRDRLIVVGGDGSVSRVAHALALSERALEFELALIPAGTGNDLARALGLPIDNPQAAWACALGGEVCSMDVIGVGRTQRRLFLNSVTGGFGGRQAAASASDQKSYFGKIAYWLAALAQLGDMPEFDLLLKTADRETAVRCLGFWLANGRTVGGGFPVAPTALLDDGLLDVVVVPTLPTFELLEAGLDLTLTGPEPSDQILTFRTSSLQLVAAPAVPLSVDGEPEEIENMECHVHPGALRIVAGIAPALANGVAADSEN